MEISTFEKTQQHPTAAPDLQHPSASTDPPTCGVCDDHLPAIFWDGTEDGINETNCADFAALQSLKTEQRTPEERAEAHKEEGNKALKFKINKVYIRKAVQHYTLALQEPIQNISMKSILHSNRAQAELNLGNFRKALMDSEESIRLNPGNEKGWFRAARSAYELKEFDKSVHFCREGLVQVKESTELQALLESAEKAKRIQHSEMNQKNKTFLQKQNYVEKLHRRAFKFGSPRFHFGEHFPKLSTDGKSLNFWVLFIYPEFMKTDVVECFSESCTFAAQLDQMFADCAPPLEWDTKFEYKRERLELYYCSNVVKVYPTHILEAKVLHEANHILDLDKEKSFDTCLEEMHIDSRAAHEQQLILVDENRTLCDVLSVEDHIISGHPTFFILSKGTHFRDVFLNKWKPFLDNF